MWICFRFTQYDIQHTHLESLEHLKRSKSFALRFGQADVLQRFQHLVDHRVFFDGRKTLDKCLPDKRCKERFVTDYMDRVNKNFLPTYYYVYNTVATQLVFFFDLRVRETRRQKMLKYSWGLMLHSLSVIHVILLNMLKIWVRTKITSRDLTLQASF